MTHPKTFFAFFAAILFLIQPSHATLLVDDCESDKTQNRLGGAWAAYHDPSSLILFPPKIFQYSSDGFQSPHCVRVEYEIKAGAPYPYAGFNTSFPARDCSDYEGVRFRAKGLGDWTFQLPTIVTAAEYNHYSSPLALTEEWRLYEIPFSKLTQTWGTPKALDLAHVMGVQWSATGPPGSKGWIDVDDIEYYEKKEATQTASVNNVILDAPKVNQVGYRPNGEKYFVVSAPKAKKGVPFHIIDETDKTAFEGLIVAEPINDLPSTGEKVFRVDFSSLTKKGRYQVVLGGEKSPRFAVAEDVYSPLFKDALRTFFLNRCGVALDDPTTGLQHAACHLGDAPWKDDPNIKRDFTGGWHNAGDYGKWMHMEAISCAWMMWLYEFKAPELEALKTNLTGSKDTAPTLLDEARWGLEWMIKMQKADGSVWHKVDPEQNFCFGTAPENDATPRRVTGSGSIDAAVFCGAMCQASRVFRPTDKAFAEKCLKAAERAWAWLEKNPHVVQRDFAYVDDDPSQETLWALGEMARTTGDAKLIERFKNEGLGAKLQPVSWMQPQLFGYLARLFDPKVSDDERDRIKESLVALCEPMVKISNANGYGTLTTASEYYWESNEALLHKTATLLTAYEATKDERYLKTALRQMNWLLGTNSLDLSFVTGHGEKAVTRPYHWAAAAYGKVIPGWAAGGPNQYPAGADPLLLDLIHRGTPPAKCFVDSYTNGSWASNEGETTENAALVFSAGYLSVK
jgi:endoglucanase